MEPAAGTKLEEATHFASRVNRIDVSPTMLARATRDTPEGAAAYVRGDAVHLPFRDASFDAVCCFAALHLFGTGWLS